MGLGLHTRAEDGQITGLFIGQQLRCNAADGGCTNRRDRTGVHDGQQVAILRSEQKHHALVRVIRAAVVAWIHGDYFDAQRLGFAHVSRHHTDQTATVRQPHHVP